MSLSQVTDEFIAYIRQRSGGWDLDQVSYFLRRGRHPARPQGGAAAAVGRGRGRGGPGAARGAGPALRPAAAVPGVQGGRRGVRRPDGGRRRSGSRGGCRSSRGSPGCCPSCSSRLARRSSRRWRPGRSPQGAAGRVDRAHPRRVRLDQGAGGADRRTAARAREGVVPAAVVGRGGQLRDRRVVPGAARALPRGCGLVRAGRAARRAVRELDRRRPRGAARRARRAGGDAGRHRPKAKKKTTRDQRLHRRTRRADGA